MVFWSTLFFAVFFFVALDNTICMYNLSKSNNINIWSGIKFLLCPVERNKEKLCCGFPMMFRGCYQFFFFCHATLFLLIWLKEIGPSCNFLNSVPVGNSGSDTSVAPSSEYMRSNKKIQGTPYCAAPQILRPWAAHILCLSETSFVHCI